jgi:hypothetical protein
LPLDTEATNTPDGVAETQVTDDDAAGARCGGRKLGRRVDRCPVQGWLGAAVGTAAIE